MVRWIFGLYLLLFLGDGTLSLADDLLRACGGPEMLAPWRNAMAAAAFWAGFPVIAAMLASPRFPRHILAPPVLFLFWTNACYAFPLNLYSLPHLTLALSGLQFAWGALLAFLCRVPQTWKPFHPSFNRPAFAWKHTLLSAAGALGVAAVCLPAFCLSQLITTVHVYTGGYVRVHPDGLYLAERHFRKEDRELRLIGMMHIGRSEFYQELTDGLPSKTRSVVLMEGVTNRQNLPPPLLGYGNVAGNLGLSTQFGSAFDQAAQDYLEKAEENETDEHPMEFRNADLDLSDFQPETLAYLRQVGVLYQCRNWRELLQAFQELNRAFPQENPPRQVLEDILHSRNEHLFGQIQASLEEYPIVLVPWGALHLPDIETRARELGFSQTCHTERKVVGFW